MFQINSYLQYKNTPDGKPRVLKEGVDYWVETEKALHTYHLINNVAMLQDCRPLLGVQSTSIADSVWWTEGDIAVCQGQLKIVFMIEENGVYKMVGRKPAEMWDDNNEGFIYDCERLGSFFDNPTKHSKLLWNCDEKEGWDKVFNLLNINIEYV
jgi:hypothetical protein